MPRQGQIFPFILLISIPGFARSRAEFLDALIEVGEASAALFFSPPNASCYVSELIPLIFELLYRTCILLQTSHRFGCWCI
jgi:hypothetical protein